MYLFDCFNDSGGICNHIGIGPPAKDRIEYAKYAKYAKYALAARPMRNRTAGLRLVRGLGLTEDNSQPPVQ